MAWTIRRHRLDEFAVIVATSANHIVPALRGTKSASVIAIMGELRSADHAAVELVVQRGGGLALVLCRNPLSSPTPPSARRMTIDVSQPDIAFAPIWNKAVSQWQQNATRQFSASR